jgi:hypothetical protein
VKVNYLRIPAAKIIRKVMKSVSEISILRQYMINKRAK